MKQKDIKEKLVEYQEFFKNNVFMYPEDEDAQFMEDVLNFIIKLENKIDNLLIIIALLIFVIAIYISFI